MIDGDADAVRFIEDDCDDDEAIRGEDDDGDEPEEVITWCPTCNTDRLFVWLSPETDEAVDWHGNDGWDRRICSICARWIPQ